MTSAPYKPKMQQKTSGEEVSWTHGRGVHSALGSDQLRSFLQAVRCRTRLSELLSVPKTPVEVDFVDGIEFVGISVGRWRPRRFPTNREEAVGVFEDVAKSPGDDVARSVVSTFGWPVVDGRQVLTVHGGHFFATNTQHLSSKPSAA